MLVGLILTAFACVASAQPQAPLQVEKPNRNYSQPISQELDARGVLGLFRRQSDCYSPNRYCPLYDKCCAATAGGCCPSGCTAEYPNRCCADGSYCTTGRVCCNDGCMPTGAQCCNSGGYCPSPFICVIYEGVRGCCTDLSCRVYLSSGVTKTATQTSFVATGATTRATTSYTGAIVTGYRTYTTTYYWYYWYYYYTILYSPNTYTTRVRTTVSRTTTLYCSATDSVAARSIFLLSSSNLPTPASAQTTLPPTPTYGATVFGRCTGSSTSSDLDGDGSTTTTIVPVCQTTYADGKSGVFSTGGSDNPVSASTSSGSNSNSNSNSGQASGSDGLHAGAFSWVLLTLFIAVAGGAMVVL